MSSDSDDDNEIYEEAIDQPLTTEGTIELAKNWTLRYSTNPHGSENNSDTGSNEYEDSSDEYTTEGRYRIKINKTKLKIIILLKIEYFFKSKNDLLVS